MTEIFDRKIYSFLLLINDLGFMVLRIPQLIAASRNSDISKSFSEKIMLVVTGINGCTYCEWFHAKQAISSGLSREEIKNMLSCQFDADSSDFELIGLLYAQHYAETNRKPEQEMNEKLVEFYGKKTAKHIRLLIRIIFFGNLSGNTFDAFLSRLVGYKAPHSNVIFELFFFIFSAPFLLPLRTKLNSKKN